MIEHLRLTAREDDVRFLEKTLTIEKRTPFARVYASAADSSHPIPPDTQEAILKFCLKSSTSPDAESILVSMASRSDLSSASEKTLSKVSIAKVKAAWMSRPGLSADQITLLLKGEKRATVLAAIAASELASSTLLSALAEDPRPTVAWAILRNSKTHSAARAKAVLALLNPQRALGWEERKELASHLKTLPAIHNQVVYKTRETDFIEICLPNLNQEAYAYLAETLIVEPFRLSPSMPYGQTQLYEKIGSYGFKIITHAGTTSPASLKVAACLNEIINSPTFDKNINRSSLVFTKEACDLVALLAGTEEEKAQAAANAAQELNRLERARTTADTEEIKELIALAVSETLSIYRVLGSYRMVAIPLTKALAENPNLPLDLAPQLLRLLGTDEVVDFVKSVVPSPSTDEEYLFLARTSELGDTWLRSIHADVPDKKRFLREAIRTTIFNPSELSSQRRGYSLAAAIIDLDSSPEILKMLPLSDVINRSPLALVPLVNEVAKDSTKIWETFEVLSRDFGGTLGEFLEIASLLSD